MSKRRRTLAVVGTALAVAGGFGASRYVSGGADEAEAIGEQEAIMLIDKGVAHLEATTITYDQWLRRNYPEGVRETTQWFLAFAAFEEAKAALSEEPPPTTTAPPTTSEPPPTTTEPPPSGDTIPPTVIWTEPLDGATVTGPLNIDNCEVDATDNEGVVRVEMLLDGTLLNTEAEAPWNCAADTASYPDGPHTLSARAFDAVGNTTLASINVTFETEAEPPPTTTSTTTTTSPQPTTLAHLWVDTNGGSCTRSSFPVAYSDGAACGSLVAAYNAASSADTILVKAGTYAGETLPIRSVVGVTLAAAAGEVVSFSGKLIVRASNVHLDGFRFLPATGLEVGTNTGCSAYPCSFPTKNVTVTNFTAQTVVVQADTVLLKDGDIGPHNVCTQGGAEDGLVVAGLGPGPGPTWTPSDNVTVDNVTIHDITNSGCGNHVDGIQLFSWHNFTLKNSRIYNTDSSLVLGYSFDENNPDQLRGMRIENNFFGRVPHPGHGVTIGAARQPCSGVVIQNNTFYGNVGADMTCGSMNPAGIFRNNIVLASYWCGATNQPFAWNYNVFANPGSGCAATANAKVCQPSFVDPSFTSGFANLNAADACARNTLPAGAPYPPTDFYGTSRPQGAAADAGAHEAEE